MRPLVHYISGLVLGLLFIDAALLQWVSHIHISPAYRFPIPPTKGELYLFADAVKRTPGPRLIFVGDSVINGGAVSSGKDTLPHYFSQLLPTGLDAAPTVFNGSITNATPTDVLFFLQLLDLHPGDTVIYNLNLGHFSKPYPFEHRETLARMGAKRVLGEDRYAEFGLGTRDRFADGTRAWIDRWRVYRYRTALKQRFLALFGVEGPGSYDTRPWYEKDWSQVEVRGALGDYHVAENNLHLHSLRQMVEMSNATGYTLVLFNTPRNHELARRLGNIDFPKLRAEVQNVLGHLPSGNWLYLDYEKAVPSPYFGDTVHPTAAGYRILARRLYADLEQRNRLTLASTAGK